MDKQNDYTQTIVCVLILLACVGIMLALSVSPSAKEQIHAEAPLPPQMHSSSYQLIGTGNRLGTYYPAGAALAAWLNDNLAAEKGVFKAIETNGAIDNIKLLNGKKIMLGMIESRVAMENFLKSSESKHLRLVWPLWNDVVQIVKAPEKFDPGLEFPGQLNVFLGQSGSSTRRTSTEILKALNRHKRLGTHEIPTKAVVNSINSGNIGYALIQSGLPNATIANALSFQGCTLCGFSPEEIAKMLPEVSTAREYVIPAGYYTENQPEIHTISLPNVLVTTSDVSAEAIETLLDIMISGIGTLKNRHKVLGSISADPEAVAGLMNELKIPVHEGTENWLKKHSKESSEAGGDQQ